MGIPLVTGRDFDDTDLVHTRVIVNEALARRWWSVPDAVGKRVKFAPPGQDAPWVDIVGVVRDVRHSGLRIPDRPTIYLPLMEEPSMTLAVRSSLGSRDLMTALRSQIRSIDRVQGPGKAAAMESTVSAFLAQPRFQAVLLSLFAALGLVLAVVGAYGVISYNVSRRTKEIGIRIAVGAARGDILKLVLIYGMIPACAGIAAGVLASFALAKTIAAFLYGVLPRDPATFTGVAVLLLLVAFAASYIPARRAMRVDPMAALRYE